MSGDRGEALRRAEEIRRETIGVLDETVRQAAALELPAPDPSDALVQARTALEDDGYQVLVMGEAKRGKSSLVNALVARDVLPTAIAVATSQVFRVGRAEQEAFRVRFEDGSAEEITAADLPRHGSQVVADTDRVPVPGRAIRWIEVDLPGLRFLPDGVSLLDTPGLGALYAAHQEITQRFVPYADAVVFVLDSERPVMATELDAVATVLEATPDVFFVQTKSDLVGVDQCRRVRERSEELLRERFRVLGDVRVLPFSNTLLRAAARDDEDAQENLEDSGHVEVEAALRRFLFVVAGWRRTASALALVLEYQEGSWRTLEAREAALRSAAEVVERLEEGRAAFRSAWGPRGTRSGRLLDDAATTISEAKKGLRQALAPHGSVVLAHRAAIERATPQELGPLIEELPARLAGAVQAEFRAIVTKVDERIAAHFAPLFAEGAGGWAAPPAELEVQATDRVRSTRYNSGALFEKAKGAALNMRTATSIGGAATTATAVIVGSGGTALPAVLLASAAGALWAGVHGWRRTAQARVDADRQEAHRTLAECAGMLQAQLFEGDFLAGRAGLVDEHFSRVQSRVFETLRTTVKRKDEEGLAEQQRAEEAAGLDADGRERRLREVEEQRAAWAALSDAVDDLGARLERLLAAAGGPGAPGGAA